MTTNKTTNYNKIIAITTALLVLSIAIISFVLSYSSLRLYALEHGIAPGLSYLWPLLVDLSLVVFSLTVVNQYLQSESAKRQWLLVAIYTMATIAFNALHAPQNIQSVIVFCVAPISLFFSFEVLMSQLKTSISKSNITNNIQHLAVKQQTLIQDIDAKYSTIQKLDVQIQSLDVQIQSLKSTHKAAQDGFSAKSFELGQIDGLLSAGISQKAVGEMLGVSVGTISNRVKALNGGSLSKGQMTQ